MTNESTPVTLQQWWDEFNFPSKNLYELKENGDLILKPIGSNKERTLAVLAGDNAEMVMKALLDKFPEVESKVKELQDEWNTADDKLKLVGKVERIRDYLLHANAVGAFDNLFGPIAEMENTINKKVNDNYEEKLKLVQQAEGLVSSEDWKETSQILRDLTDKWKAIGYVDKERNDGLWERLEAARAKFFDNKRNHQEDVKKEMLVNLDIKMELVEKAEQLASSEDWKATTEAYKELMEKWKGTGHTLHEKNESLWGRFILAKNTFFDRKRQNFESIHKEQEVNYAAKLALVEKAESIKDSTDWNETTKEYSAIMEEWKKIGRVGTERGDELWNRMNAAKDTFFNNRRQHFETVKVNLEDNMAMKQSLIKRAEALQNSTHWRDATEELNELMDEWKKTGAVPREHSKRMWEQFLTARKKFFERKDANRELRKQKIEKKISDRKYHMILQLETLENELKEEIEKLEDFKNSIENITPGKKAEELKTHLTNLIEQTEKQIANKKSKIEAAKKQVDEMNNENEGLTESSQEPEQEGNTI